MDYSTMTSARNPVIGTIVGVPPAPAPQSAPAAAPATDAEPAQSQPAEITPDSTSEEAKPQDPQSDGEGSSDAEEGATPETKSGDETEAGAPKEELLQKKRDPFASRFAALSKKDKEIRALEKELKERGEKIKDVEEAIAKAKEDPDNLLQKAGISYQDLVEHYLKGGKDSADNKVKTLEDRLNKLEQEKLEAEKARQEAEAKQNIDAFHQRIDTFVNEHGERFELVKLLTKPEEVYNVMVDHYLETEKYEGVGRTLTIEQACSILEERFQKEIATLAKQSPKMKKVLAPLLGFEPSAESANTDDAQTKQANAQKAVTGAKTLSNAHLRDRPVGRQRYLSREESIAEMAKKLKFLE